MGTTNNPEVPFDKDWFPLNPFENDEPLECGIETPEVCESCE